MKKLIAILLFVVLMVILITGCQADEPSLDFEPVPEPIVEATTEPSSILESIPEQCEHEWLSADCNTPETCSICGETLGESLAHDFTEAPNYQEPSICLLCGEEGEPLTPGAISNELNIISLTGTAHRFDTITCTEFLIDVTGEVTLVNIDVTDNWGNYEAPEGYEFIVADINLTFTQAYVLEYGVNFLPGLLDFYTYDPSGDVAITYDGVAGVLAVFGPSLELEVIRGGDPGAISIHGPINYYGEDIELLVYSTFDSEVTQSGVSLNITYAIQVPIGYDGMIIAFINARMLENDEDAPAGDYIDRDTLFFRLRG